MAARSTKITFHNQTEFSLAITEVDLPHGEWTEPWEPPASINANSSAEWRSESDGIATGTEGSVRFVINGAGAGAYVHWDNPYSGSNKYHQFTDDAFEIFHTGGDGNDATVDFFLMDSVPHYVPGFTPGANGLHFSNTDFGDTPYTLPPLRGTLLDLKYGNAKNGLCGGMVYTVKDYYLSSFLTPATTTPPSGEQDSLFIYIVDRLFDSFDIDDVTLYLKYMDPLYPDTDENIANSVGAAEGRAFIMANVEFPLIRQDILGGTLSPMGLIMIKSVNPGDLGSNHQVMAYGYQMRGDNVEIYLYDPNSPNVNSIKLSFNAHTTAEVINVTHNVNAPGPIYCFFRTNYDYHKPVSGTFSLRLFANVHHFNPANGFRNYQPQISSFRSLGV